MTKKLSDDQNKAVAAIVQTWNGGERVLAGKRASELVYGGSNKPNEALLEAFQEQARGIELYISAPQGGMTVSQVPNDTSPTSTLPEADQERLHPSNMSSEDAKDDQDEIDKALEAGRKAREKATDNKQNDPVGDTRYNPEGSDADDKKSTKK